MLEVNDIGAPIEFVSMLAVGAVIGLLGCFVAFKRPENAVGWWFVATGYLLALNAASSLYGIHAVNEDPGSLPFGMLAVLLAQGAGGPIVFMGFVFVFLLFPTGHLLSPRWRLVTIAAWLGFGFTTVGGMLDEPLRFAPLDPNPISWPAFQDVRFVPEMIASALMLGAVVASLMSMVLRYRRSRGEERQQMRWVTWAAGLLAVTLLLAPLFWTTPSLEPVWGVLWIVSVGAIPVSAAVAILKYRLYDIDVIINRTLVYGALTAMLAGTYLAIVVLLQLILEPLTAESDVAVAASTLAVAALFRPLRTRVQAFIDRRFYRRRYDAARTLDGFSARLRQEVDLDALSGELVGVVHATMQPAHASLWLRNTEVRG